MQPQLPTFSPAGVSQPYNQHPINK